MRVVFYADVLDFQNAGVYQYLYRLLCALERNPTRHQYALIRSNYSAEFQKIQQYSYPTRNFSYANRFYRSFFLFPRALRSIGADVVVESTHFGPFRVGKRKKISIIHDLTAFTHSEFHPLSSSLLQRILMPMSLKSCDRIVANSNYTKSQIISHYDVKESKICVQHPIIPKPNNKDLAIQPKLEVPYLLAVGTIEPRKNIHKILRMYKMLLDECPEYHLVFVGKLGWKYGNFIRSIDSYHFRDQIHLIGRVSQAELEGWYASSSLVLFASEIEGFGMPIAEALVRGKKLIVSDHPSMDEACGLCVERVDVNNSYVFMRKVEELLKKEELRINAEHLIAYEEKNLVRNWELIIDRLEA